MECSEAVLPVFPTNIKGIAPAVVFVIPVIANPPFIPEVTIPTVPVPKAGEYPTLEKLGIVTEPSSSLI